MMRRGSWVFGSLVLSAFVGGIACSEAPADGADAGAGAPGAGGSGTGGSTASGGAASGGAPGTGGSDAGYPALEECSTPSLDRLQKWWGTAEGPTIPGADQSLLVADGAGYLAHVEFASAPQWHVAPIWIGNAFTGVDVSSSTELRIEYKSTAAAWLQLRPGETYSGGDKWHYPLPSTADSFQTLTIPLDSSWEEKFGTPPLSVADTLKDLVAVVLIGSANNQITIRSLRIQGYTPPCL